MNLTDSDIVELDRDWSYSVELSGVCSLVYMKAYQVSTGVSEACPFSLIQVEIQYYVEKVWFQATSILVLYN